MYCELADDYLWMEKTIAAPRKEIKHMSNGTHPST